jgi:hypothetical protein
VTMTCHIGERLRWKSRGKSAGKHGFAKGWARRQIMK